MPKGVLIDLTKCIGCRGCQTACKQWNQRETDPTKQQGSYQNPPDLNSDTFTLIEFIERDEAGSPAWDFVKHQCMHCKSPACVSACPVAALTKTKEGPVSYTYEKCIGCRYCMVACPFSIPKYEWDSTTPWVQKCTFCSERMKNGETPACVKVCPTGTMIFGDLDQMVNEAKKRITAGKGRYVEHIYGEKEAGGTSWLYISDVPFAKLGFKENIPARALDEYTWASLSKIPTTAVVGAAALGALAFLRNRGNTAQEEE